RWGVSARIDLLVIGSIRGTTGEGCPARRASATGCLLHWYRMKGLARILFIDFPRSSWQWDIAVALIVLFIFATPRSVFNDQPRAESIVFLPANQGYLLESGLLDDIAPEQRASTATQLVQKRFKTAAVINRVEAVVDEGAVTGYMAFTGQ